MTPPPVRLRLLPTASVEIDEQEEYYREYAGESLAHRWRTAVNATLRRLRDSPNAGAATFFESVALRGVLRVGIDGFSRHFLFYKYDQLNKSLLVISVLHGSRDVEAALSIDVRQ